MILPIFCHLSGSSRRSHLIPPAIHLNPCRTPVYIPRYTIPLANTTLFCPLRCNLDSLPSLSTLPCHVLPTLNSIIRYAFAMRKDASPSTYRFSSTAPGSLPSSGATRWAVPLPCPWALCKCPAMPRYPRSVVSRVPPHQCQSPNPPLSFHFKTPPMRRALPDPSLLPQSSVTPAPYRQPPSRLWGLVHWAAICSPPRQGLILRNAPPFVVRWWLCWGWQPRSTKTENLVLCGTLSPE